MSHICILGALGLVRLSKICIWTLAWRLRRLSSMMRALSSVEPVALWAARDLCAEDI